MPGGQFISTCCTWLISYHSTVWLLIIFMPTVGLTILFGGGYAVPFLPFPISWIFILYCFHSIVCCTCCGQLDWLNWYFLHQYVLQSPATFFICICKCCSDMVVLHMSFVSHVIILPVFMTWMLHEHPLWSLLLTSTIALCVHGPPSSCCTDNGAPTEKKNKTKSSFFEYHCPYCIFMGL